MGIMGSWEVLEIVERAEMLGNVRGVVGDGKNS